MSDSARELAELQAAAEAVGLEWLPDEIVAMFSTVYVLHAKAEEHLDTPWNEDELVVTTSLTRTAVNAWRLDIAFENAHAVELSHWEWWWRLRGDITRLHAPHVAPGAEDVISDHAFRHGGVIVETLLGCVLFEPEYPALPDEWTYMDLEPLGRELRLAHGMGRTRPHGHVLFRREGSLPARPCSFGSYGHRIVFWPGSRMERAYRRAEASHRFRRREPPCSYDHYAAAAVDRLFAPDVYREEVVDGRAVGGTITQSLTAKRRPGVMDERGFERFLKMQKTLLGTMSAIQKYVFPSARGYRALTAFLHAGRLSVAPIHSFGVWFNQVRTALGAALHARDSGDAETGLRAERMLELALSAPLEDGASPSVAVLVENRLHWLRGTRAFELVDDAYHLPDMAVTGFHLLEWYEHVEALPRILERCRAIAEFLLERQEDDGTFPSWVRRAGGGWTPDSFLRRTAASAAPAMFFARLARFDDDPRWTGAAVAALAFIRAEILPADDWNDFELALSCAGRVTSVDPRTGVRAANTMSIYWAARAALDLALAGRRNYRGLAQTLCARLALFQQPADLPRLSMATEGGFACMNTDAELSDARQGLFVPLLLDWFRLSGKKRHRARALAALRACFSLMLIEENRDDAPGNLARYRESDRGAIVENYGHTGRDEPTAGYLAPDWGIGTSLYALGMARVALGAEFDALVHKKPPLVEAEEPT